jgi:UDP-glucose 4-epimerase
MRAMVSGGAGFIGSHLVDALLDRGDEVAVVDDLSTGRRENLEGALSRGAAFHEVDIRDAQRLHEVVAGSRPDIVFHLAAQIDVRKSIVDPAWDAAINIGGTINLLEAARDARVKRVVNTSTGGAIYGETDIVPTPEGTEIRSEAPYGQAKYAGEGYLSLWNRLHGLSTVSLRFGNVYGPRQDPLGEAGVIAIFCGKLQTGGDPTVFGDGRQTRDYVFVEDVVNAFAAAGRSSAEGILNISTGVETSVSELAAAMQVPTESRPSRPGEVRRSCLSPRLAAEVLGWRARTALDEGLPQTLA